MPRLVINAAPAVVLATMTTVGLCAPAPAGDHALGGLIHACRLIGAVDDGLVLKIGQRIPVEIDGASPPKPSLRALCAPRRDHLPSASREPFDTGTAPRGV